MERNQNVAVSLELLLESLIKMVGKSNQNMEQLSQRVTQLERLLADQQELRRSRTQVMVIPTVERTKF